MKLKYAIGWRHRREQEAEELAAAWRDWTNSVVLYAVLAISCAWIALSAVI